MNTKRIIFWSSFAIVLALIIWDMVVSMNKNPIKVGGGPSTPPTINSTDHIRGPSDAKVTIIEYADFECPACAIYSPLVERLLEEASTTVRLIPRHFPLSYHKNGITSALAAEASGRQDKFWDMYAILYERQADWSESGNASKLFESYAEEIGLDIEKYKADLLDPELRKKIEDDRDGGIKIGINQTPSFFINGKFITNPSSYEEFKKLIESAASSSSK